MKKNDQLLLKIQNRDTELQRSYDIYQEDIASDRLWISQLKQKIKEARERIARNEALFELCRIRAEEQGFPDCL